ncbi:hypothetical protein [Microcoleus sp. bin38.metabat.b11b12b14.051]|nr:hypothetical protein [Microcoleus sp. bin38.metabat.b11b12b14.051]
MALEWVIGDLVRRKKEEVRWKSEEVRWKSEVGRRKNAFRLGSR